MRGYSRLSPGAARLLRCSCPGYQRSIASSLPRNSPFLNRVGSQLQIEPAPEVAAPLGRDAPVPERKRTPKVPLSNEHLPSLEFWQRNPRRGDLTPEECHRAATIYLQHANPNESTWKGKLQRDYNITANTMYTLAVAIVSTPSSPLWRLAVDMLGTASDLSYDAATLLLVRIMKQSASPASLSRTPIFPPAMARFRRIAEKKRDPDALTMQGVIFENQGNDAKALECFRQALQAAPPKQDPKPPADPARSGIQDPPSPDSDGPHIDSHPGARPFRWTWEASCHLGMAKVLLRQNRSEEAIAALKIAAFELDNAQGYLQLAKTMPEDTPERNEYLRLAAVYGLVEASRLLGESEVRMAERPDQSKEEWLQHCLWGKEWLSLGDDPVAPPPPDRLRFPSLSWR